MRKKTLQIALICLIVAGAFLVIGWNKTSSESKPCEESMEECCKKKPKTDTDNQLWETLSGQFFSSSGLN